VKLFIFLAILKLGGFVSAGCAFYPEKFPRRTDLEIHSISGELRVIKDIPIEYGSFDKYHRESTSYGATFLIGERSFKPSYHKCILTWSQNRWTNARVSRYEWSFGEIERIYADYDLMSHVMCWSLPSIDHSEGDIQALTGHDYHELICIRFAYFNADVGSQLPFGSFFASYHETFCGEPKEQRSKGENEREKREGDSRGCCDRLRGPINGNEPGDSFLHPPHPFPAKAAIAGLLIAVVLTAAGVLAAVVSNR